LVSEAAGDAAGARVGRPPAWVSRPDVERSSAAPLVCFATGQAPLGSGGGRDAQAYALAAEEARRDGLDRLARRGDDALARVGLSAARAVVLPALEAGARVKGRYVGPSNYHVWLAADIGRACDAAGIPLDGALRSALALALEDVAQDPGTR
jgi:hypothetical protein